MNFEQLIGSIQQIHLELSAQATKAINLGLTLRNWAIGLHITEYEQIGADRAVYGERLLDSLSLRLQKLGLMRVDVRELRRYRQFYLFYPQIREALPPGLLKISPPIRETVTPESCLAGKMLLQRISFSHFAELLQLDDPLKRRFYEVETLRGNWSVRELKRQINTLYFERSGLSTDKEALSKLAHSAAEPQPQSPRQVIRDPYVFEFLGLKAQEVMGETDLEDALLDKLQEFLLELGHGFCFEARQKRLLIGDEYFFVDLVFYHRILKCHVLIELKNDAFRHEHLGQLNSYVACYQKTQMTTGDNPPVGILLCTRKNHALVEFALSGMDSALFVSRYAVELPKKDEMAAFLDRAVAELGVGDE